VGAEWLNLSPKPKKIPALEPGQSIYLNLQWVDKSPSVAHRQLCLIQVQGDGLDCSTTLEISPPPRFELDLPEDTILVHPGQHQIPLRLRLIQGRARLLQTPFLHESWGRVECGCDTEFPRDLDAAQDNAFLDLSLVVDGDRLHRGLGNRGRQNWIATLEVPCAEREDVPYCLRGLNFDFALAPELTLEPFRHRRRATIPISTGLRAQSLTLVAHNSPGRADLVIEAVQTGVAWAQCSNFFPMTIAAAQSKTLNLDLQLASFATSEFELWIVCNDSREHRYVVNLDLREMSAFDGSLVIDFGTTSTCAALVDQNLSVRLVPLDPGAADPRMLPTLLAYHRLEPQKEVRAGQAEAEAARDPDYAQSVVRGLKRRLGPGASPYQVVPFKQPDREFTVSVRQATEDFLELVVNRAQAYLLSQGRHDILFTTCVITHPSRFSWSQLESLKNYVQGVLEKQLLDRCSNLKVEELITIQEPVAASLDFLHDPEWHEQRHLRAAQDLVDGHLLVYDFGGGTVDITLLRVGSERLMRRPSPGRESRPVLPEPNTLAQALFPVLKSHCDRLAQEAEVTLIWEGMEGDHNHEGIARIARWIAERGLEADLREAALGEPSVSLRTKTAEGVVQLRQVDVLSLLPPRTDLLQAALRQTPPEYRYRVRYQVLGAVGHRRFGGEDVTQSLVRLLEKRMLEKIGPLPLDIETVPLHQLETARRNRVRLQNAAERLKVLLSDGAPQPQLKSAFPGLSFWIDGNEKRYSPGELWDLVGCPSLDELNQAIQSNLQETLDLARNLIRHHSIQQLEAVLSVGKGSLLPSVQQTLRTEFPQARHVNLSDRAKTIVVEGAGRYSQAEVQSGGRVVVRRESPLTYTVSRLGIRLAEQGRGYFHEFLPAGVPVPDDGLEAVIEDLVIQPGRANKLTVLENCGLEDRLELNNGEANPDVTEVRRFLVQVPSDVDPFEVQEGRCWAHLSKDLNLALTFEIPGLEPIPFEVIPSKDLGRDY